MFAHDLPGRVGEWLKPADCKSAAPCGLRRFESSPVHHELGNGLIEVRLEALKAEVKRLSSKARRARDEIGSRWATEEHGRK